MNQQDVFSSQQCLYTIARIAGILWNWISAEIKQNGTTLDALIAEDWILEFLHESHITVNALGHADFGSDYIFVLKPELSMSGWCLPGQTVETAKVLVT